MLPVGAPHRARPLASIPERGSDPAPSRFARPAPRCLWGNTEAIPQWPGFLQDVRTAGLGSSSPLPEATLASPAKVSLDFSITKSMSHSGGVCSLTAVEAGDGFRQVTGVSQGKGTPISPLPTSCHYVSLSRSLSSLSSLNLLRTNNHSPSHLTVRSNVQTPPASLITASQHLVPWEPPVAFTGVLLPTSADPAGRDTPSVSPC